MLHEVCIYLLMCKFRTFIHLLTFKYGTYMGMGPMLHEVCIYLLMCNYIMYGDGTRS